MKWDFIKSLSHLVVLGNANDDILASLLTLNPVNTTLFAVDAWQSQQVQQYVSKNKVIFKQGLIAAAKQTVDWYKYNLPQLSAIAPANEALTTLFPGLKLQQKTELDATDVAAEVKALNLSGQQNMLLLCSPVQNLALLQRLAETEQLTQFSSLVVQHTHEVFYPGAATLSELTDYLTEQGYQLLCSDQTDPDFPILQFYRDAKALALKQMQLQLDIERQAKQQAISDRQQLQKQLEHERQAKEQATLSKEQLQRQNSELIKELELIKQQAAEEKQQSSVEIKELKEKNLDLITDLEKTKVEITQIEREFNKSQAELQANSNEYLIALNELSFSKEQLQKDLNEQVKINHACNSLLLKMNMYLSQKNES